MTTAYEQAKIYSNAKLDSLRSAIRDIPPNGVTVITSGSYARREASDQSDIDYFAVLPGDKPSESPPGPDWIPRLDVAITKIVPKAPAEDGAFKDFEYREEMLHNIGGANDTNAKITRRILLLLEGDHLAGESEFRGLRQEILERYIQDSITDHQLALFLLNDIIRYYRTMAVDFEFKTFEAGKPWAIRNIKLMFSRKLLYASGLFSVAMTADATHDEKRRRLEQLFDMPVIDRMIEIAGKSQMTQILSCYNHFLERLGNRASREHLNGLPRSSESRHDKEFRELKNEGHHFTRHILALFENTFGSVHPIRKAVIF
jgi:hypothetical protein